MSNSKIIDFDGFFKSILSVLFLIIIIILFGRINKNDSNNTKSLKNKVKIQNPNDNNNIETIENINYNQNNIQNTPKKNKIVENYTNIVQDNFPNPNNSHDYLTPGDIDEMIGKEEESKTIHEKYLELIGDVDPEITQEQLDQASGNLQSEKINSFDDGILIFKPEDEKIQPMFQENLNGIEPFQGGSFGSFI